jgi:positive regulator of sigma E activity
MKERGVATKVEGQSVTVRVSLNEGCESCNSKDGCAVVGREFQAEAAPGTVIAIGDTVDMELPDSVRVSGAFWLLAVPLGLFALGYVGGGALFPGRGEGVQALLGLLGMAVGLVFAATVARRGPMSRKPRATPVGPAGD